MLFFSIFINLFFVVFFLEKIRVLSVASRFSRPFVRVPVALRRVPARTAAGFRPLRCLVSCGVPVAENLGAGTGFPLFAEIYLQTYTPRARGRVPVRPAARRFRDAPARNPCI